MNEAVAVFSGPDHLLAYYNPMLSQLFGERPLGQPVGQAFPDLPEMAALLDEVEHKGEPQWALGVPVEVWRASGPGEAGGLGTTGSLTGAGNTRAARPVGAGTVQGREQLSFDISFSPLRDQTGAQWGTLALARDVTATRAAAERAQRSALLARMATDLSRSLDLEETARAITRVGADMLGGFCLVDILELDGSLRRLAGSHQETELQPVLEELATYPRATGGESLAQQVARTGRPATGSHELDKLMRFATQRRHATILRRLSPGPYLIVPLVVGGRLLGALSVVRSTGSPAFTPRERALVDELTDRASLALAHARDFDEQRTAALTFQRSLLPTGFEAFPGIEVAVRYRAAARGSEVGGDWYDVITLPDPAVGLVIGDVEGHDVSAAALMGQVRSVVRAYAQEGHPPAVVAQRTNAFLRRTGASRLVTMLYMQLFPDSRLLTSVRVGHLPPLLLSPGVAASELSIPAGPPFGVNDTAQWAEATVQLPEGSVLALFTDGLVEEPGVNLGHGIERLARALDNLSGTLTGGGNASTHDLESVADLVIAGGLAHGDHSDDFALLLVRLPAGAGPSPAQPTSSGTGATTAPAATPPIHAAARRLPATLSSSPIARRFVGDLLREWGVSSDVSATAELLTGELVGNAARNAEAEIEIKLRLDAQRVRVDVFDESHRMPELRPAGPEQTAGRGLMVVNNLSSRWGATVEERGKSVWFELDL